MTEIKPENNSSSKQNSSKQNSKEELEQIIQEKETFLKNEILKIPPEKWICSSGIKEYPRSFLFCNYNSYTAELKRGITVSLEKEQEDIHEKKTILRYTALCSYPHNFYFFDNNDAQQLYHSVALKVDAYNSLEKRKDEQKKDQKELQKLAETAQILEKLTNLIKP